ncbi:L-asparaginase 1 [Pyrenophora tritici-repentis Pt-1C-BFP]|uniref:asparaginase n=1 Tax=Pyrenophora tritici-repentis (strain Pt-1C-BFP) TaxID=426418 RepID=B2WHU5_PYRTR|nr:L-asparaginase 1 [Pyrenophora tritici-repentis Pt-1C-BFP]EDU42605.1 L-asparaginase 1 [Pyrenophora tritici-repentis Pt-1C-BFP]
MDDDHYPELQLPESRVLIVITGGTICMRKSVDGLVPARGFLKAGLAPRPVFNDGSYPEPLEIVIDDKEDFDAFGSPNLPPLATVSSTRTNVLWHRVHRSTDLSPFTIQTSLDTAHVACLRVFPGITPVMVDAVLRLEGLKGLVLETFGAGNTPGGPDSAMTRCLADAVKRGIVIVNVTQCLSGSVSALYAPGAFLGRAGVVFGQDLTSEAALTKLAYLLALPDATPEEVAKRMSISLRGELTETTRTHFEHPSRSGVLTPELSSLTALGYAVQKGDLQATKDIIRGEPRWLLNDADYQMNSPVHLAATSPNVEILRDFLAQGASVHLRNRSGNTPLFLAAAAGLPDHVQTLIDAGAHLHSDEVSAAKLHASEGDGNAEVWARVIG